MSNEATYAKIERLKVFYALRLDEILSHKNELNNSNESEELKLLANAIRDIRINEIKGFITALHYDIV